MRFKFFCDKLTGHKSVGISIGHDEAWIAIDLFFWSIGIAKIYPWHGIIMAEDLRKDI